MAMDSRRTRVLVPGDTPPPEDFYAERTGSEAREPLNQTAFRQAERRYKSPAADYSELINFSTCSSPHIAQYRMLCMVPDGRRLPVYGIKGVDGLLYIPGALSTAEQLYFAKQSFATYCRKPNATNLDAHWKIPDEGLFPYYRDGKVLDLLKKDTNEQVRVESPAQLEKMFIRKLRWITLGYQYNWTTKKYNFDEVDASSIFPTDLETWIRGVVDQLVSKSFRSEAGIVNFYQLDDTLTGHVDRSEKNMEAPLVSLSIGLSAIFLLGGQSREDTPVHAIKIQSGDLCILNGPARLNFHGVPKVLKESAVDLEAFAIETGVSQDPDTAACLKLIKDCRININARQVN
jgi:alkylated DNA repair protein alkB family protein 1